jgi:hypothetical protein
MESGGFRSSYLFERFRREKMRVFAIACLTAAVIALGAAAMLDNFVQQSAAAMFTDPTARI